MDTLKNKNRILSVLACSWLIFTVIYASLFIVVPAGSTLTYETTKFVFLSISAFGVLFSALLSSYNSLEASINSQDKMKFDLNENSFKYMERWDSPALKEARDLLREIAEISATLSENALVDRIEGTGKEDADGKTKQENLKRSVITMFNFFEEIELSLQASRVNEEFIKRFFKDVYKDTVYRIFLPWLKSQRNTHIGPDMRGALKALHERW